MTVAVDMQDKSSRPTVDVGKVPIMASRVGYARPIRAGVTSLAVAMPRAQSEPGTGYGETEWSPPRK